MANKLISSVLFLAFAFMGCSKEGENDPSKAYWAIPQEIKDYTFFKVGSYWIYQDSTTGSIDSVYVYNYWSGVDTVYDGNQFVGCFEYIFHDRMHSTDGYTDEIWVNTNWTKNYNYTPIWYDKFKPGDYLGETYLYGHPFIDEKSYGDFSGNGHVRLKESYSTYIVLSDTFNNVLKFNCDHNIFENNSSTNIYIAKNIGIIRFEVLNSNAIWNLIRYNSIQ